MNRLLALSALVVYAAALPVTYMESDIEWPRAYRAIGFASYGNGTRGGAAGTTWTVWDAWALRDAIRTNDARIVYVRGRIDLTALFANSPGVVLDVGSRKTIIGGDATAEITGGGLRIKKAQQVIIQNIKFSNSISYAAGEQPDGAGGIVSQIAGVSPRSTPFSARLPSTCGSTTASSPTTPGSPPQSATAACGTTGSWT